MDCSTTQCVPGAEPSLSIIPSLPRPAIVFIIIIKTILAICLVSHRDFNVYFLRTKEVENIFMCLFTYVYLLFAELSVQILCSIFIGLFHVIVLYEFFIHTEQKTYQIIICKHFLTVLAYIFTFVIICSDMETSHFYVIHLSVFPLLGVMILVLNLELFAQLKGMTMFYLLLYKNYIDLKYI